MATTTDNEAAVTAKIAELPEFSAVCARLHEVIMQAAPELQPRLWYGMPGYALKKSSPVLCFFRDDKTGYVSFGLTEKAHLSPDEGANDQLMGGAWYLTGLDAPTEERITEIVRSAVRDADGN